MTREAAARLLVFARDALIAGAAAVEVPKLIKAHRAGGLDLADVHISGQRRGLGDCRLSGDRPSFCSICKHAH